MIDAFFKLDIIDKFLLCTLIVSLILKFILDVLYRYIDKRLKKDKTLKKPCIYLKSDGKEHQCTIKQCERYFVKQKCDKKKCVGYQTSQYGLDVIKKISIKWFFLFSSIKWISELSGVILIARTLLK